MPYRLRGLLLIAVACALPVAAVMLIRPASRPAGGAPATQPAVLPPPAGPGLQPLLLRQELVPAVFADRYLCRFPIGNGSERTVTVTGSTTTCGCSAVRVEPPAIAPGAWGEVVVEMTGKGRLGLVESQIELLTDDGRPPVVLQARVVLPPQPRVPGDEILLPAGRDEVVVPLAGGNERFPLRCLGEPQCSNPAIAVRFESGADGPRLVCRLTGPRPAAGRARLRLGYDEHHAVDIAVRVIAE